MDKYRNYKPRVLYDFFIHFGLDDLLEDELKRRCLLPRANELFDIAQKAWRDELREDE